MPESLAIYFSIGMAVWLAVDYATGYSRTLAARLGFRGRDVWVLLILEIVTMVAFWPIVATYYLVELLALPVE